MVLHEGKNRVNPVEGLIMRAVGRGFKVCLFRFAKGPGEVRAELRDRMPGSLEVHEMWNALPRTVEGPDADVERQRHGWEQAAAAIASGQFQLVILEELPALIGGGAIAASEVLECLLQRPAGLHVAITGMDITESLVASADIVTKVGTLKANRDNAG